ncbi:hypothetical protein Ancab_036404 [Ancistrocladus abbreviatus]
MNVSECKLQLQLNKIMHVLDEGYQVDMSYECRKMQDSGRSAREHRHGSPAQNRREPGPCGLLAANCGKRSHGLSVRRVPELGGFMGVLISSLQHSPVASGVDGVFRGSRSLAFVSGAAVCCGS